jgi:hypothetical protein
MILKIFSPKNWRFFAATTASFCTDLITTMIFEKQNTIFSPKIAENCDNNIDSWAKNMVKCGVIYCDHERLSILKTVIR